jgi:hypothetical protein|tara:strand:- start:1910 stop:2476 length:567 start_codon:yes stop_codon:yes gene_type:complete
MKLTRYEDQQLWISQLKNTPKPFIIEIYKNASRFTKHLSQTIISDNHPMCAIIRNPYDRFWSACKEIFSEPNKDGTPRGEKDPIKLIEIGLLELENPNNDFHFSTQTWFRSLYPWHLDHVFVFENLQIKEKCEEWKIEFKSNIEWNTHINISDHTNDAIALEHIKNYPEIKEYYHEDFKWYNSIINRI